MICLVNVDDTLFYSPKPEYSDELLVKKIANCDMELEEGDDAEGFLGIDIKDRRERLGHLLLLLAHIPSCSIQTVGT